MILIYEAETEKKESDRIGIPRAHQSECVDVCGRQAGGGGRKELGADDMKLADKPSRECVPTIFLIPLCLIPEPSYSYNFMSLKVIFLFSFVVGP